MSAHLVFRFYEYRFPPDAPVEVLQWARKEIGDNQLKDDEHSKSDSGLQLHPFIFEETDSARFVGMGLRPKTAASLQRFRQRGGVIRSLKDWYTLRVLSDDEKERLAPYLRIRSSEGIGAGSLADETDKSHPGDPMQSIRPLSDQMPVRRWSIQELNQSDSAGWDAIPGVGPATARRVIEYRNRLGGYIQLSQLLEIYGMDSPRYEAILPFVKLEVPANIRRISLNQCSEVELSSHPYAGSTLARRLIAFRERHGLLPPPDSLVRMKLYGVEPEKLKRLLPYLKP
jgi:DNA uptake protein ComE-like DNA-binding protein